MKLYKYICSAWIKCTSVEFLFFRDWRHKHLKNTIVLLLFYGEHLYGFSESDNEDDDFLNQKGFSGVFNNSVNQLYVR